MRQTVLVILLIILSSLGALACSCSFAWNDSFSRTTKNSEFVALIKIISFDEYLEHEILGYEGKIPYSMKVEIIKKYKGKERRKKINILGDTGILCRPFLSDFKVNGYYLIAPIPIDDTPETEYDFFACRTDYLEVNIDENKAYGNYSMIWKQINISTFESKLEHGDWDLAIVGSIGSLLILILLIVRRNKKRTHNRVEGREP